MFLDPDQNATSGRSFCADRFSVGRREEKLDRNQGKRRQNAHSVAH
jgi:hypothetical protein